MNKAHALSVINSVHFLPGWNIVAEPYFPYPWENSTADIRVTVHIDTVNSNQDQALKGYPEHITIAPSTFTASTEWDSEEEILAAMFTWLMQIFTHEAREFFRVGKEMKAPFHPHRPEGEAAFERIPHLLAVPAVSVV